jgi:hypothetical protein
MRADEGISPYILYRDGGVGKPAYSGLIRSKIYV